MKKQTMIRKPEVLRDYTKENALVQVQLGNNVIAALMNNPTVFIPGDLPVSAADLTTVTSDLSTKYNDFKQKGHGYKEPFIAAQLLWVEKMNLTADYVELIAKSNGADAGVIIQMSAFHMTKTETEPATLPAAPVANMEISNSDRGTVAVSVKPVEGSKGFVYSMVTTDCDVIVNGNQITVKAGNSIATFIFSTKRDVKFVNLPATQVTAAVAAVNSAGLGQFSTVTNVVIP